MPNEGLHRFTLNLNLPRLNCPKANLALCGYIKYILNLRKLKRSIANGDPKSMPGSANNFGKSRPIFNEFLSAAGTASGHYFHQDLLVANYIFQNKPKVHLDIGSRIDGFIAHLLSFDQKITLGDIRPVEFNNANIAFIRMDLSSELNLSLLGRYESISCLHAIEHIGLGRYGDPVNAMGHYIALKNLGSLLSSSGTLYLSYPFGIESRIEYNAHRVISLAESCDMFYLNKLAVRKFAYVNDYGNLVNVSNIADIDWEYSYHQKYGCAIWVLHKE